MAEKVYENKSSEIKVSLEAAQLTGIDWKKLSDFVMKIITMLAPCLMLGPNMAQRRFQALARGEWYPGANLHSRMLDRELASSGICTGAGNNPATNTEVRAAVLDTAAGTTASEFTLAYAEARSPAPSP